MKLDLEALQDQHFPRLSWRSFIKIEEGKLEPEQERALYEYFSKFIPNTNKRFGTGDDLTIDCVGCGKLLAGGIVGLFLGQTFTWGIAHGEGYCRECGYPARAIHYDVGPIKRLEFIFQYHPEEIRSNEEETKGQETNTEEDPTQG